MNRIEFLSILSGQLTGFTEAEKREILCDYEEHFASGAAEGKTEEDICRRLGDPADIAREYVEARLAASGKKAAPSRTRAFPPYRRPERLTFGSTMEAMHCLYQSSTGGYVGGILLILLFSLIDAALLLAGASVCLGALFSLIAVPFLFALYFWMGMIVLFALLSVFFIGLLICGAGAALQKCLYRIIAGMAERKSAAPAPEKEGSV